MQATLSPEEQERISDRPTENLEAYTAYLRGLQLVERRNSTDMDKAMGGIIQGAKPTVCSQVVIDRLAANLGLSVALAVDQLHDVIMHARLLTDAKNRDDVRVVKFGGRLSFTLKACHGSA